MPCVPISSVSCSRGSWARATASHSGVRKTVGCARRRASSDHDRASDSGSRAIATGSEAVRMSLRIHIIPVCPRRGSSLLPNRSKVRPTRSPSRPRSDAASGARGPTRTSKRSRSPTAAKGLCMRWSARQKARFAPRESTIHCCAKSTPSGGCSATAPQLWSRWLPRAGCLCCARMSGIRASPPRSGRES